MHGHRSAVQGFARFGLFVSCVGATYVKIPHMFGYRRRPQLNSKEDAATSHTAQAGVTSLIGRKS